MEDIKGVKLSSVELAKVNQVNISSLKNQEWYSCLIEECKAIITEAIFISRWALVEGYWHLGERIDKDAEKLPTTKLLQGLAVNLKISERTLWYALQFFRKYPELAEIPEGKNITWNKLITKYLPKHEEKPTQQDWLRFYDVWNFAARDGYFGERREAQCPPQVILNFIYYFTYVGDLIVDPMAGGGATTDCATCLYRRSLCYDLKSLPKKNVIENDIRRGYPSEAKDCDAIFIDPPYFTQKKEAFVDGSVSNLDFEGFQDFLEKLFKDSFETLKDGGKLGFIISTQTEIDLQEEEYLDLPFLAYGLLLKAGFYPVRRISVPFTAFQYKEYDMARAKENKRLLGLVRDLLVFGK